MNRKRVVRIQKSVLTWYAKHGRDLPWRHTRDPYAITVSEVMLQQTQVSRVMPKYRAWLKRWPNWDALTKAATRQVLQEWSGLGYNRRGLALRRLAEEVVERGALPRQRAALESLPGIGPYTAGAIQAFAWQEDVSFIDTNIRRVVGRVTQGIRPALEKKMTRMAAELVPPGKSDVWHHALMDIGAMICTARKPMCDVCPLQAQCRAYPAILDTPVKWKGSRPVIQFTDSDRFWRGRVIWILATRGSLRSRDITKRLAEFGTISPRRMKNILNSLIREKMVHQKLGVYSV